MDIPSTQDRWRAIGYKKAIASIAKYHKPLETYKGTLVLCFLVVFHFIIILWLNNPSVIL